MVTAANGSAKVVIQWCPGLAQKQSQRLPVPQQITNRLPQPGVRLSLVFCQLRLQPLMQTLHDGLTLLLMELQPLLRTQTRFARHGVNAVNPAQLLQHVTTLDREVLRDVHDLPPSMGKAMRNHHFHPFR